jgi:hypothetical protein
MPSKNVSERNRARSGVGDRNDIPPRGFLPQENLSINAETLCLRQQTKIF